MSDLMQQFANLIQEINPKIEVSWMANSMQDNTDGTHVCPLSALEWIQGCRSLSEDVSVSASISFNFESPEIKKVLNRMGLSEQDHIDYLLVHDRAFRTWHYKDADCDFETGYSIGYVDHDDALNHDDDLLDFINEFDKNLEKNKEALIAIARKIAIQEVEENWEYFCF